VTGGDKQACEIPQLKAVNTVLGNLKTAITGTNHAFKFDKYADRYLAEYEFQFNRRFDLGSLAQEFIRAAANCKPTPMRALRMAEDCR
jgi:ISXO2-like transposase domain